MSLLLAAFAITCATVVEGCLSVIATAETVPSPHIDATDVVMAAGVVALFLALYLPWRRDRQIQREHEARLRAPLAQVLQFPPRALREPRRKERR